MRNFNLYMSFHSVVIYDNALYVRFAYIHNWKSLQRSTKV